MSGADADQDTGFANLQASEPVDQRQAINRELCAHHFPDFAQFARAMDS